MPDVSSFESIGISIASPTDIREWSHGEVKKPETINYRTFKPERDGLFCERIFGPVKDWECHCGRYKKVKFKGVVCDRCGVEVTRSNVRRERMGHIELAAPAGHIWYLKGVPSPLSLILDITPRPLEKVMYFASYIITRVDRPAINDHAEQIRDAVEAEIVEMQAESVAMLGGLDEEFARRLAEEVTRLKGEDEEEDEFDDFRDEAAEEPLTAEEIEAETAKLTQRFETEKKQIREREEKGIIERVDEMRESATYLIDTAEVKLLIPEEEYRSQERLLDVLARRVGPEAGGWVQAGLGAAAIRQLLNEVDLEALARELKQAIRAIAGPRRVRAVKRLDVVEAFIRSRARPDWMIMEVVPIIPPELRPMVQLDGGRFATSDLNDLYRRIINRNNRLKKIMEIRAPESIVNHEKRLLQEAVDALIDNGRRARPVVGSNNRPLRSLSDMLKGKEGRFRKNLLGKRVDYSGRSVIVVGPNLKLNQCGLPREMALELFKPYVMKMLVETGATSNIKTAKRMIDRMNPIVWDSLEWVIAEHPVMLNRAPTLHRLGIQAFEPVLTDGKAIQVHPLVCTAFNADFDGDQMAVHVPLSEMAQAEARVLMLSTQNLFSPANGGPLVGPTQDIVLGLYYLTECDQDALGKGAIFADPDEALRAYQLGKVGLLAPVKCRVQYTEDDGEVVFRVIDCTIGRLVFNAILPPKIAYRSPYIDRTLLKGDYAELVELAFDMYGPPRTIELLDDLKDLGYDYSTRSGITIATTDMAIPSRRQEIIAEAKASVVKAKQAYRIGAMSAEEQRRHILQAWQKAASDVGDAIMDSIPQFNPIFIIVNSGSRGSKRQIAQLCGMRGLMTNPFGQLIDELPITSNFHEGLSVLEFFVSTHGARKGLADTALRTADAGYLTRRLVDVSQDVIIRDIDCGTQNGIYVEEIREGDLILERLEERVRGRCALEDIVDPETGEVITETGALIEEADAERTEALGIKTIGIRTPYACELRRGICARCYGEDLARGGLVEVGTAVGIIAAQSIGEPGTQLTMRTFHTGGVAGEYLTGVAEVKKKKQEALRLIHRDIESGILRFDQSGGERAKVKAIQQVLKVLEETVGGLLRVVELFEARKPKGQAIISETDGYVEEIDESGLRTVHIISEHASDDMLALKGRISADEIKHPETGKVLCKLGGKVTEKTGRIIAEAGVETVRLRHSYLVPYRGYLQVKKGQKVRAGQRLTEGPLDPHKVLDLQGVRGVQEYLVWEIQAVYKNQGVDINDKHVEIIVRQMLKKRRILTPGDTRFLPGHVVTRFEFEDENIRVMNTKIRQPDGKYHRGEPATAEWVLLGITEASLQTDSFLSAASFQKTTRVLTDAAVRGKLDFLQGLKENVIIGRLIPAGTGLPMYRDLEVAVKQDDGEFGPVRPLPMGPFDFGTESISSRDGLSGLLTAAVPKPVVTVDPLAALGLAPKRPAPAADGKDANGSKGAD